MRPRIAVLAAMVWAILATAVALGWYVMSGPQPDVIDGPTQAGTGEIKIGGPFELVAHTGEAVTDATFRGKLMLVFFGYTFCPDVCPTDLQIISEAMDILGEKGRAVQPIFITVDPERDSPDVLSDYVRNFHPRLIGLTGTQGQIAAAAKAYRAVYYKADLSPSGTDGNDTDSENADEEDGDYLMNHSIFTYLMGPNGEYRTVFAHGTTPEEMAEAIAVYLEKETLEADG